jgi:hypothetical protein
MKTSASLLIAALSGVMTFSAVDASSAAGGFSYASGQVQYSYTSPGVSVYGDIQIGGSPSTTVTQKSGANIAVVGQMGTTPYAKVTQTGKLNGALVTQVGNAGSLSFGNYESLIGN